MRFRYLLGLLLYMGQGLADLTCKDFVPHNWTSPLARLYLFDDDDYPPGSDPPTLPANLSITDTLTLASKKSSGSVFRMKSCTSKSLGLKSVDSFYCPPPEKRATSSSPEKRQEGFCNNSCARYLGNNLQLINPATGHCLTWQQQSSSRARYSFIPCNPDPTDLTQIFSSSRFYYYYTDETTQKSTGVICDWGTSFQLASSEAFFVNNTGAFESWALASDNRTIFSGYVSGFHELEVFTKHHDPLTNYHKAP